MTARREGTSNESVFWLVNRELLRIAREIAEAKDADGKLGLSEEEAAFCSALTNENREEGKDKSMSASSSCTMRNGRWPPTSSAERDPQPSRPKPS